MDSQEYQADTSERKASEERAKGNQERSTQEAEFAKRQSWKEPDGIARYIGWLQLHTFALFAATILLFGAAVVTAIILYKTDEKIGQQATDTHDLAGATKSQADAMAQQVSVMQGQLSRMQASGEQTNTLIAAAQKSADAAKAQAEDLSKQIVAMNGQVDILRLDQRPWIGAPKIEYGRLENGVFKGRLTVKNVGKTPTIGLYVGATIFTEDNWVAEASRQCERGTVQAVERPSVFNEWSIAPGDELTIDDRPDSISIAIRADEIATRRTAMSAKIIGCVLYKSRFDDNMHTTKFFAPLDFSVGRPAVTSVYAAQPN